MKNSIITSVFTAFVTTLITMFAVHWFMEKNHEPSQSKPETVMVQEEVRTSATPALNTEKDVNINDDTVIKKEAEVLPEVVVTAEGEPAVSSTELETEEGLGTTEDPLLDEGASSEPAPEPEPEEIVAQDAAVASLEAEMADENSVSSEENGEQENDPIANGTAEPEPIVENSSNNEDEDENVPSSDISGPDLIRAENVSSNEE